MTQWKISLLIPERLYSVYSLLACPDLKQPKKIDCCFYDRVKAARVEIMRQEQKQARPELYRLLSAYSRAPFVCLSYAGIFF